MNFDNPKTEQPPRSNRFNRFWKRTTKLEQILLVLLILTLTLLIGVLLFVIIIHAVRPNICDTPECIRSAADILEHIDPSIDPCDDFYKFACGTFVKSLHGNSKDSSVHRQKNKVDSQLEEIIKSPISEDDNKWLVNQKKMYTACLNETEVGEDTYNIFMETLDELNGWPVIKGFSWKDWNFDWYQVMVKLREKGMPWYMFFYLNIDQDLIKRDRNIIQVELPYFKKIEAENKNLYTKFMIETVIKLGAERNRAETEMEKVVDFMENLDKIKSLLDEEDETNCSTKSNTTVRYKVEEFQKINGDMNWLEFINSIINPVGQIYGDDEVIFPNATIVEGIFKILNRTPKRTLANYIMWTLLESILEFMPKRIREPEGNYTCLTEGSNKKERKDFCKLKVERSFYPSPTTIAFARKNVPIEKKQKIQEIVSNIKAELRNILKSCNWMDDESRVKVLEKANDITEIIGAPRNYYEDTVFCQTSDLNYTIEKSDNFFEIYLHQRKFLQAYYHFRIHLNTSDTKIDEFNTLSTAVNAMYSILGNIIIIPAGILQGIFFNMKRPMYLNYGLIGSLIGHELSHGFGDKAMSFDKDGYETLIWTNATSDRFKEKVQCLIEEADNFEFDDEDITINGTRTLEENLADFTGFKLSYLAYQEWVVRNGQEPQLPGIGYTPNQLFWISSILYECYDMDKEQAKYDRHAYNYFRVISPIRNNANFTKDFSCPEGSKMNPPEKCEIF